MYQIRKSHFSQIEAFDYYLRGPRAKGEAKIQDLDHSSHFLLLRDIRNDETVICDVCEESLMDNIYRCKDCNFNVDVLCAKLQPEIQLSIHPNHPLTLLQLSETQTELHFLCDFCNNRCYSDKRQSFRCKRCNFKIDLDCARMLLNCKPIQHVSHEHWLIVKWVERKDRKYCAACREVCDGETYCCNRCYFFLHKSCAEYPTEIQLYFHSEHPLTLHSGTTKERERCDFCNLICQSLTFRCDLCNFKIHFRCARMLNRYNECDAPSKYVRNSTYRHSLSLSNTNMNDVSKRIQNAWIHNHPFSIVYHSHKSTYHGCTACGQHCNGPTYVCFLCRFSLHESCLELLQRVYQNSFHKHPLVIIEKSLYNFAICSACGEPCLDPIYICLTCKFYFHELCLALPQEIQHFSHPCPLTLRQEIIKFTCGACEKSHTQFAFHCGKCRFYLDVECAQNYYHQHPLILNNKELNHDVIFCFRCSHVISGEIYGCMQCDFYLHRSCAAISQGPQQIKHPFHPNHLLTLCYDSNVWCSVSILKSFDEMGEVKYLRHKHFAAIQSYKRCAVCEKNSYGPSYNCISCKFFVHQNCLEPAKELQHPFHLHDLPISVLSKTHIIPKFSCDACHNSCSGFSYQCHECKRGKKFEMDVHCASLKPSINYKDHEHFLTFFEKMDDDPQCEVCKSSYRDASYLRCVKCDFTVHLLCVPLPCTIKHKCHIHPLHLVDFFVEDDSDEYYCDACENIRDPRECVYLCARCGNYVAQVNCVIDKVLLSLSGRRGNVELRSVDRQKVDKLLKRGLTLEYIFSYSNEDDKKEFVGFEAAVGDLIREIMSRAEFRNMEDILENSYSDEIFIVLLMCVKFYGRELQMKIEQYTASVQDYIYELENAKLYVRNPGMTFWDLKSEVIKVGGYKVSRNFAPILESLFEKYGDISANSSLNPRTKTRFINIFGGVAHSMCNTEVTTDLLFNWWMNFKLVQHAGFNIQFAFDNLYKLAQSWFCLHREFLTNETLLDYHVQIRGLKTKFEELKVKQKQCVAFTKRKSLPEKERLIADIELISNTPRPCFL